MRSMCSWGLLFSYIQGLYKAFCLKSNKIQVDIQRYSYKLNFVIFNCLLCKFWWSGRKHLSETSFLISFERKYEESAPFQSLLLSETVQVAGIKRVGKGRSWDDLWQTLLWKWDNLELQGWTRNRRQGMKMRWKKYSRRMKHIKDHWEGGGTVINGE